MVITVFCPMCLITETFRSGIPVCLHALISGGITAAEPEFWATLTPELTTVFSPFDFRDWLIAPETSVTQSVKESETMVGAI